MRVRLTPWLLLAFVLVAVPFWWLLIGADRGNLPPKPLHIADLRLLANTMPGPHPTALTYTVLATRLNWGDYAAAGIGLQRKRVALIAWSLPVPDKGPVMIDPVAAPAEAGLGKFGNFNRFRQGQLDEEASSASLLLFTQAHQPATDPAHVSYITAQAVAPGVVEISASSHAPGSRMIFVQLADGREFLFAGGIAALTQNWTKLRARSRLAAEWGPPQDRHETYAWLRTIRQLRTEAPGLQIVPGHDAAWVYSQRATGAISEFQPAPQPAGHVARASRAPLH